MNTIVAEQPSKRFKLSVMITHLLDVLIDAFSPSDLSIGKYGIGYDPETERYLVAKTYFGLGLFEMGNIGTRTAFTKNGKTFGNWYGADGLYTSRFETHETYNEMDMNITIFDVDERCKGHQDFTWAKWVSIDELIECLSNGEVKKKYIPFFQEFCGLSEGVCR